MKIIIVDTNIVFSALLNAESKVGEILLNNENQLDFYTSEHLRYEINKHKKKLLSLAKKLNDEKIDEIIYHVFSQIKFISDIQIPFENWVESAKLVRDIDKDDIQFVALTEYLGGQLWTGDKKLLNGLVAKGYQNCITTEQLYSLIQKKGHKSRGNLE